MKKKLDWINYKEESSWRYVHERPDLVEEIISNQKGLFDLETRTKRLIELVEYGARVESFPTDLESDQKAIEYKWKDRATISLARLIESHTEALDVLVNYLVEHWNEEAVIEIEALLSVFKIVDHNNSLLEVVDGLIEIINSMAKTKYLYYDSIKLLVRFWDFKGKQKAIESCLLMLLNNRHYRSWTLDLMRNIDEPTSPLVEEVKRLADIKNYDEAEQLSIVTNEEKNSYKARMENEYHSLNIKVDESLVDGFF